MLCEHLPGPLQGKMLEKCDISYLHLWRRGQKENERSGGYNSKRMREVSVGDCLLFVGKGVKARNAVTIAFRISIVVYIGSYFRS